MKDHLGKDIFKLGFGLMRLPKNEDGSIDIEQTKTMADMFIEGGGTYFDTAFVYDGGKSEEAFKLAVADRYPREAYTVCTKLNSRNGAHDEQSAKDQFNISLERTGAGYFDFYLLHALMPENRHLYDEYHIWDYVKEKRDRGLIKHWGFSFHDSADVLERLLDDHPDVDFIQLQLNYADWNNPSIQSGRLYEIATERGIPFTVMEPVKGGSLAHPPEKVKQLLLAEHPDWSFAQWAISYAASLSGVITVLSGMSNIEQMQDNLSFMKNFKPLNEKEQDIIVKAREILEEDMSIPCTACEYCVEGCPMNIPIPGIFKISNDNFLRRRGAAAKKRYAELTEGKGKASDCIACGQCEGSCPQQIEIIELLKVCSEME